MSEIFFVAKALVISMIVIMLMQIKIGQNTIEQRSLEWMRESVAVQALRGVAESAVTVFGLGYDWVKKQIERSDMVKNSHDILGKKRNSSRKDWESAIERSHESDVD